MNMMRYLSIFWRFSYQHWKNFSKNLKKKSNFQKNSTPPPNFFLEQMEL